MLSDHGAGYDLCSWISACQCNVAMNDRTGPVLVFCRSCCQLAPFLRQAYPDTSAHFCAEHVMLCTACMDETEIHYVFTASKCPSCLRGWICHDVWASLTMANTKHKQTSGPCALRHPMSAIVCLIALISRALGCSNLMFSRIRMMSSGLSCGTRTRNLCVLLYWPLSMRPRQHRPHRPLLAVWT